MGMTTAFAVCTHEEEGYCCFRKVTDPTFPHPFCKALSDASFDDGLCHFRKRYPDGPNLYDKQRKAKSSKLKMEVSMTSGKIVCDWE